MYRCYNCLCKDCSEFELVNGATVKLCTTDGCELGRELKLIIPKALFFAKSINKQESRRIYDNIKELEEFAKTEEPKDKSLLYGVATLLHKGFDLTREEKQEWLTDGNIEPFEAMWKNGSEEELKISEDEGHVIKVHWFDSFGALEEAYTEGEGDFYDTADLKYEDKDDTVYKKVLASLKKHKKEITDALIVVKLS